MNKELLKKLGEFRTDLLSRWRNYNNREGDWLAKMTTTERYIVGNFILVALLVTLVVVLTVMSMRGSNRLIALEVRSGEAVTASSYYQTIELEFTRPISPDMRPRLADLIEFEPAIEGRFQLNERKVIFAATEPLAYNQNYQVNINPELVDSYGQRLVTGFSREFTTRPLRLLYTREAGDAQELVLATLGSSLDVTTEEVVIKTPGIREYAADPLGKSVVVTVQPREGEPSDLYIYDIERNEIELIELPERFSVTSPKFSRFGELFFLGTIPDVDLLDFEFYEVPEVITYPYRYNLDSAELTRVEQLDSHFGDILELIPTPDGNSLLIKKFNFDVVIVSLLQEESTPLGKFNDFGGFDYRGEQVAVLETTFGESTFTPVTQVIGVDGVIFQTGEELYTRDPSLTVAAKLAYSVREENLEFSEGRFAIEIVDYDSGEMIARFQDSDYSLELGNLSPDGDIISVEYISVSVLTSLSRDVRTFLNPGRPISARLVLKDIDSGAELELGDGYNLLWIF